MSPRPESSRRRSQSLNGARGNVKRQESESTEDDSDSSSSSSKGSEGSAEQDRGRSRIRRPSNSFSEDNLRRRGYHSLFSSFGKVFHVEKRWKMIRDMGSGAYGVVISAADDISGETVAIKQVTRVFDKVSLAKRALREITLLRHFSNHENITGLIDVDAISPDFNEIYLFMEPMEADLHQIIKSGQGLTNEHVQYFLYQILRGMKYIHSASVVHRDLKPGNLLVNSDCELKICDFGLARGFDSKPDDNQTTHMTEYVATRWYRAPEIMLAFRRYGTPIDVWSIGCILGELLQGRPLFKGKEVVVRYLDQLNKILDVLGTPDEAVVKRIGSEKAQAYVRSLPHKKTVPFKKLMPAADHQALDLLAKMLAFDPQQRITVLEALEHPWLASYHDVNDEPECPMIFDKWRDIEKLETIEDFRRALWDEIGDYRREVRSINFNLSGQPLRTKTVSAGPSTMHPYAEKAAIDGLPAEVVVVDDRTPAATTITDSQTVVASPEAKPTGAESANAFRRSILRRESLRPPTPASAGITNDPVVNFARRSSILYQQHSATASPLPRNAGLPSSEDPSKALQDAGGIPFPGAGSYIVPARSRTASLMGGEYAPRKLLRTLSTVSIHESVEGIAGGLAAMGPIGKFIAGKETGADAPASEMPREFGIEEKSEGSEESPGVGEPSDNGNQGGKGPVGAFTNEGTPGKKKEKRFILF
ncbi:Pkinase-domain-containing protein [Rickenella mellea]|uniref:mitogen-activated protein kinase n=1 Tax=Rickenella mellea TaxID=50990 RepID=A0A4Y7Q8T4_9AGAM|nr:Pkinase-domain-containing protein [Rickenella mellea]